MRPTPLDHEGREQDLHRRFVPDIAIGSDCTSSHAWLSVGWNAALIFWLPRLNGNACATLASALLVAAARIELLPVPQAPSSWGHADAESTDIPRGVEK